MDSLADTAARKSTKIAKEVEKLADEGKNIVLVPHSYGGVPTTESTKGLSRAERQAQGKPGGIVRLAYMTCLVPAMGMPAAAVLGEVPEEQQIGMKIDVSLPLLSRFESHHLDTSRQEKGFLYHEDIARAADLCFTDMSPEAGMAWIKRFPRHSSVSFGGPLTHAGYKDIPVSYLVCENDRCIPPDHQRKGIDLIEKVSGRKVDVSSLQGDHCAPAYNGQEVSQWLLAVARKS